MSLYEPLRDTWSTSLSVARQRLRSGGRRRLLLAWILQALALYLVGQIVPGFTVTGSARGAPGGRGRRPAERPRPAHPGAADPAPVRADDGPRVARHQRDHAGDRRPAGARPRDRVVRGGRPGRRADHDLHDAHLRDHGLGPGRHVLRGAGAPPDLPRGGAGDRRLGADRGPDRRPRRADPAQRDPGRDHAEDGQLGPLRAVPPGGVGVRAAVADLGEPGGDPPREQRQHPGLPLVREGDRAPAGLEPPGRRHRDRAPGLGRSRAAGVRRDQRGQPVQRRRDEDPVHDEPDGTGGRRRRQRVLALLRGSRGVHPDRGPHDHRGRQGAAGGASPGGKRHPAARAPGRDLRRAAGGQQRAPARPQRHLRHGRDAARDADRLRGHGGLRRAGPPRGSRAARDPALAGGRGPGPGLAPAGGRIGAAGLPDRRRVRPRPEPGGDVQGPLRRDARRGHRGPHGGRHGDERVDGRGGAG